MSAFVLNRKYQVQLPNSFVDVDSEEMEYVDGGFNMSRDTVAWIADALIALVTFGVSSAITIGSFLRKKGATSGTQLIVKIATRAGIARTIALNFAKALCVVLCFTIGYGIAYLADRFDSLGLNGRVQF